MRSENQGDEHPTDDHSLFHRGIALQFWPDQGLG